MCIYKHTHTHAQQTHTISIISYNNTNNDNIFIDNCILIIPESCTYKLP